VAAEKAAEDADFKKRGDHAQGMVFFEKHLGNLNKKYYQTLYFGLFKDIWKKRKEEGKKFWTKTHKIELKRQIKDKAEKAEKAAAAEEDKDSPSRLRNSLSLKGKDDDEASSLERSPSPGQKLNSTLGKEKLKLTANAPKKVSQNKLNSKPSSNESFVADAKVD